MAPPDRDDVPRDTGPLTEANLTEDSRLWPSAARMTSWLEWLLHPEEHEYDRTVIYRSGGTVEKREEPGPVTKANPLPGQLDNPTIELDYESVIEGYHPWQFLHGMAAVATQQVERPNSILGRGTDALYTVYWLGERQLASLVDAFPEDWKKDSEAGKAAHSFLLGMQDVAGEIDRFVDKFYGIGPRYAVIIKGVRDNLRHAAEELTKAFEDKFANKPEDGVSIDMVGAVLTGVAAAGVVFLTAGTALPAAEAAVAATWSTIFTEAAKDLLKNTDESEEKKIHGYWWRDIAKSYFHRQALIFAEATEEIKLLNDEIVNLASNFDSNMIEEYLANKYGS